MPTKNDDRNDRYTPVKKFIFPAGECGGEIRINIPVYASKEDVESAFEAGICRGVAVPSDAEARQSGAVRRQCLAVNCGGTAEN